MSAQENLLARYDALVPVLCDPCGEPERLSKAAWHIYGCTQRHVHTYGIVFVSPRSSSSCLVGTQAAGRAERSEASDAPFSVGKVPFLIGRAPNEPSEARRPFLRIKFTRRCLVSMPVFIFSHSNRCTRLCLVSMPISFHTAIGAHTGGRALGSPL